MSPDSDELQPTPVEEMAEERPEEAAAAGAPADVEGQQTDAIPETESGPDLSFLDDDFQEKLKSELPPEAISVVAKHGKNYLLRMQDYTRKTMALADERREAKAQREAAENWLRLQSDPEAIDVLTDYWKGRHQKPDDNGESLEDLFSLDPQRFVEFFDKRYNSRIESAAERARREALEAIQRPQQHDQELAMTAYEWAQANGTTQEVMTEAINRIAAAQGGLGDVSPDKLASLLPDYVELVEMRRVNANARNAQRANSQKVARARTASPRGGAGNVSTDEDAIAAGIASLRKKLGREPRLEEMTDVIFRHWHHEAGRKGRDLDKEMKGY